MQPVKQLVKCTLGSRLRADCNLVTVCPLCTTHRAPHPAGNAGKTVVMELAVLQLLARHIDASGAFRHHPGGPGHSQHSCNCCALVGGTAPCCRAACSAWPLTCRCMRCCCAPSCRPAQGGLPGAGAGAGAREGARLGRAVRQGAGPGGAGDDRWAQGSHCKGRAKTPSTLSSICLSCHSRGSLACLKLLGMR